jgi:DNA-damage-inducible protein D
MVDLEVGNEDLHVMLFGESPIRRTWNNSQWFYSVVDIAAALISTRNTRRYWGDLKIKLKNEGFEVYEKVIQLKFPTPDGKMRNTDGADRETVLRIIQSIPSPKVESFKRWFVNLKWD